MRCNGYNGSILAEGDKLTLTHSGFPAKAGGLVRDQPREIPLQAVSSVHLKPATRMTNGWLTLGIGGVPAPQLSAGTAASDANTVLFRHRDKDHFKDLYDWLLTVIAHYQSLEVDPSAQAFDPAGQTRSERVQEWSDRKQAEATERSESWDCCTNG